MKIGIFGGSFNPPHNMHEEIATSLIQKKYVDRIIFVPTGKNYPYKTNLLDNEIRYHLLEFIVSKNKLFSINTFEFQDHVVYTYQTLDYFRKKYPNDEIYFICGADNLSYIDQWKNGYSILEEYKILVIPRNTHDVFSLMERFSNYENHIIVAEVISQNISSSQIREFIQKKDYSFLKNLLDRNVLDYIQQNHLYLEEKEESE